MAEIGIVNAKMEQEKYLKFNLRFLSFLPIL
jgi:hypothetical protein